MSGEWNYLSCITYPNHLHFYGYAATAAAQFFTSAPAVTEAKAIAARNAGLPDTARPAEKRKSGTVRQKKADASIVKRKKEEGKNQSLLRLLKKH